MGKGIDFFDNLTWVSDSWDGEHVSFEKNKLVQALDEHLKTLESKLKNAVKPEYMRSHILRNWERKDIENFCYHLLGEEWQVMESKLKDAVRLCKLLNQTAKGFHNEHQSEITGLWSRVITSSEVKK